MPPVALQLGFAGTARSDPAAQPGHIRAASGQAGRRVLKLCQLHLQLSLRSNGVQGKDIQYQHGAVDHAQILYADVVLHVAYLNGCQVAVKHDQRRLQIAAHIRQLAHFAGADECPGIRGGAALHHAGGNSASGGVQQACQLVHAFVHVLRSIRIGQDADQHGAGLLRLLLRGAEGIVFQNNSHMKSSLNQETADRSGTARG